MVLLLIVVVLPCTVKLPVITVSPYTVILLDVMSSLTKLPLIVTLPDVLNAMAAILPTVILPVVEIVLDPKLAKKLATLALL